MAGERLKSIGALWVEILDVMKAAVAGQVKNRGTLSAVKPIMNSATTYYLRQYCLLCTLHWLTLYIVRLGGVLCGRLIDRDIVRGRLTATWLVAAIVSESSWSIIPVVIILVIVVIFVIIITFVNHSCHHPWHHCNHQSSHHLNIHHCQCQ